MKRHLMSSVGMGFDGTYNRLYTVTAQVGIRSFRFFLPSCPPCFLANFSSTRGSLVSNGSALCVDLVLKPSTPEVQGCSFGPYDDFVNQLDGRTCVLRFVE
jgi:hypothetical protein